MIHEFKNILTDFVLRLIAMTGGDTLRFRTRYRFMFTTRYEPLSNDPNEPEYILHGHRAYLREPEWHLQWSIYNDTL